MSPSPASDPMADLTDHDIASLDGKNIAHFVTLNEDGSAHSAPLWIDVDDDGDVLVNSALGRKKDRNIRRDPRVVVSVHAQEHDGERWTYVPGQVRVRYRIRPDRVVRG